MGTDLVGIVRKAETAYNGNDGAAFVRLLAASVEGHDPSIPEPLRGPEAVAAWFEKGHTVFPDLRMEPVRTTAAGDAVAVEYVETGTHQGAIPGPGGQMFGPTGKTFRHRMCIVYRLEGEQIAEFRLYWDVLGVMAQLGLGA